MKIKSIEVRGLWHLFDLKWELNPNVNILTGINGAGKTTLFDIVASLVGRGKLPRNYVSRAEKIIITFEDGTQMININIDEALSNIKAKAEEDEIYQELWSDVSEKISAVDRKSKLLNIGIEASISKLKKNNKSIPIQPFLHGIKVSIISTFDDPLSEDLDKTSIASLKEKNINSALDFDLKNLLDDYAIYLAGIGTEVEQYALGTRIFELEYIKGIYKKKNLFFDILDKLFADTHKRVDRRSGSLRFISDYDNKELSISQLSSGEKQLIYILITILLQNEEEYIVFMDEPEVSLHVDWQEQLIESVRMLNPKCQLIIASHAPALLMRGWHAAVQNLEDLKTYRRNGK